MKYNVYVFFWDGNTAIAAGNDEFDAVDAFFDDFFSSEDDGEEKAKKEADNVKNRHRKKPQAIVIERLDDVYAERRGKITWHI